MVELNIKCKSIHYPMLYRCYLHSNSSQYYEHNFLQEPDLSKSLRRIYTKRKKLPEIGVHVTDVRTSGRALAQKPKLANEFRKFDSCTRRRRRSRRIIIPFNLREMRGTNSFFPLRRGDEEEEEEEESSACLDNQRGACL